MSNEFFERIAGNVKTVRERIGEAASRSGRSAEAVRLVAVSKYAAIGDGMVEALLAAGCRDLGEARPQLLLEKAECYAGKPVRWHLIGSLQRNKVRKILPHVALVHSLDSVRLAEAIDRIVDEENGAVGTILIPPVRCLLEVAISGDINKHGFTPGEVLVSLDELGRLKNLSIEGLMCMSGLESNADRTRREFEAVRRLAETLREHGTPPNIRLDELSMGMSDDFEIAVEEGATVVRIGSLLYR